MYETQKNLNMTAPEFAHMAKLARALPATCRQAFTLRKVYGFSGREIANRLGIPEHAVEELLIQAARGCAQEDDPGTESLARRPSLLARLRLRIADHE